MIELIVEKSKSISVMAGVDPESKTSVYRVVGTYGSSTYRQIFMKMMHWADHQIYHDEIIDLTAVDDFDMDDVKVQAVIQMAKRNSLTRRVCYLTDDPAIFKRIKQTEAAYIEAGISNFSVHDNLSDIRTLLGLPNEWEYPDLIPLIN